jgi:hypothetical protein
MTHPGRLIRITLVGWALAALAAGCSSDDHKRPELRAALDRAQLSLRDSVGVALAAMEGSVAVRARLVMDDQPVFSVGALEQRTLQDVRIDVVSGAIVSTAAAGTAEGPCDGDLPLTEALAIAEQAAGGEAVAVVPDDDVACAHEIQVMVADTLWEVKVAGSGEVLEKELSDEYGGSGDDD